MPAELEGIDRKKMRAKREKKEKADEEAEHLKKVYLTLFFGTAYSYLNFVKNPFNKWLMNYNN